MRRSLIVFALLAGLLVAGPGLAQPIPTLTLQELEQRINAGELGKIRAVSARQSGETVYRKRFGGGAVGDRIDIKSAGKSITAIAIGIAIDEGALAGVEVKVWPFLGQKRSPAHNQITVADLLSMSSALDCDDWDKRSPGQEEKMYRKRHWSRFALNLPARDFARGDDGLGPFSYCTAGVFLLGQVIEKATGERFDRYLQSRLFDPLGVDGANYRKSRSGEIQSGGQLVIADDALLKIGQMLLDEGQWEGQRIVSKNWIKRMFTRRHTLSEFVHYGYLFWMIPLRSERGYEAAWMMKGNGGNIVAIVPSFDAVLVVQSESYNQEAAERSAFTALSALLRSLDPPERTDP